MENTLQKREPEVVETTHRREPDRVATPRADILETSAAVVVLRDVPGVDEKNVEVTLEKDVLTVVQPDRVSASVHRIGPGGQRRGHGAASSWCLEGRAQEERAGHGPEDRSSQLSTLESREGEAR